MKLRLLVLSIFLFCCSQPSGAQSKKTAIIKGKLINSVTKTPFSELRVTIPGLDVFTIASGDGNFNFSSVPFGDHGMIISGINVKNDTIRLVVDKDIIDLGEINLNPSEKNIVIENTEIPTIAIEDISNNDAVADNDASSSQGGGFFVATQDPFLYNILSFFYNYRFKPRGIYGVETQLNGVPLVDYERGYSTWGQLGGLNDVLRGRSASYGLKLSEYDYGSINGLTYLDATAADQRKGTTLSYTNTNRSYRNRIMLTHNTGLMNNGWAYSFSMSRRWANEGFVKGTFYESYSFYAAVSKKVGKGMINLTAIGASNKFGRAVNVTDEMYELADDNQYNPAWGYQNGKKRNARVTDAFQPLIVANYTYRSSDNLRWNTALGYSFGKYKSSSIDFYNAYSPYPDYYRNMPSYYLTFNPPNTALAAQLRAQLKAHPEDMQIDWDGLYNVNYLNTQTIYNVNGVAGNNFTGRRSLYVLSNYVDDMKKINFNTNFEYYKNEHLTLYGGLKFTTQTDEYYKELADLLGGDYYVNYNQFATQQTIINPASLQNNLNNPNQIIKKGNKYGYNYIENIKQGDLWGQAAFAYSNVDLFVAADAGYTTFFRNGLMRNGLFPNNSYGHSPAQSFFTYKIKGGITYKLNLRNFLYLNAEYRQEAPLVANTYVSVSTRDFIVDNPKTVKAKTMEGGFIRKSPTFNARITGYVTEMTDATNILRFFNDDPAIQSFVNYVLKDVGIRSIGTELMGSYKLTKEVNITGIVALGQTFYTNNPTATIYQDNDPTMTTTAHKVYIKNYYIGNGPQSIYTLGVNYRPRGWHAHLNLNYIDNSYVQINPERRTTLAADTLQRNSPAWKKVYEQEKLPGAFTIDISGGKTFDLGRYFKNLHHRTSLAFNCGIVNLLNNKNIKTYGSEQLRYDYSNRSPDKFPNKYDYAFGLNYYANISLRF
jgi:hypothetical protein